MKLYRFRLVPESPWLTPWQSDTFAGLLCWACAHTEGDNALRRDVIDPARAGRPPFVLSDAFPNEWLPVPVAVRLADWPPEQRGNVKRARWLDRAAFERFQRGRLPEPVELIRETGVVEYVQLRNCIGRTTNTTAQGGELFPLGESVLAKGSRYLTIYARIQEGMEARFWAWVEDLACWGFGADRSAGKGQFSLASVLEPVPELDAVEGANGRVVLSTFQPAAGDPDDGAWDSFTKYGKLGPDFGLENVFKRPVVLLRPGACFRAEQPLGWCGRSIPMTELLASDVVAELQSRGKEVVQWAFGLSLPCL